jgi:hypothetical protein
MLDPELVEDPDDHAADIVASAVGGGNRIEQKIKRALMIAGVQCRKRLAEVRDLIPRGLRYRLLEPDTRGQPLSSEAPRSEEHTSELQSL